jgi:hypothetical protein
LLLAAVWPPTSAAPAAAQANCRFFGAVEHSALLLAAAAGAAAGQSPQLPVQLDLEQLQQDQRHWLLLLLLLQYPVGPHFPSGAGRPGQEAAADTGCCIRHSAVSHPPLVQSHLLVQLLLGLLLSAAQAVPCMPRKQQHVE